jgi:protein-S-isoprenylcysteine O-methyltransferase Ste14
MTLSNLLVIAAFAASLAAHARAARNHFVAPEGLPPRSRLIGVLFLMFSVTSVTVLIISPISIISASAALLLYGLAALLFHSAIRANRERPLTVVFTKNLPVHLVTSGPYRYIRHPFYAAYCLTWFATAVATRSYLVLGIFLCMTAAYFCAARYEESKFAQSHLGSEYTSYRNRTGMFLPGWKAICGRSSMKQPSVTSQPRLTNPPVIY